VGRHIAHLGENWNAYRVLVVKPEGKRPLGRPIHRRSIVLKQILDK
jgi:hypothetical protein